MNSRSSFLFLCAYENSVCSLIYLKCLYEDPPKVMKLPNMRFSYLKGYWVKNVWQQDLINETDLIWSPDAAVDSIIEVEEVLWTNWKNGYDLDHTSDQC